MERQNRPVGSQILRSCTFFMESTNPPSDGFASRKERIEAALRVFREQFPEGVFGHVLTKDEEEAILGFGEFGV